MKRMVPLILIGFFALYVFEQKTGRDFHIGSTLQGVVNMIDNVAGTSFSSGMSGGVSAGAAGGFAGGYGMATGVAGRVGAALDR